MAVLVNSSNFESAIWTGITPVTLNLNSPTGVNEIWIGFKDSEDNITWTKHVVVVDTTPPVITITQPQILNEAGTVVPMPMIQLQGYGNEDLLMVSYDVAGRRRARPGPR